MRRTEDWLRQARKDLGHAEKSTEIGDYEWACFAAQQAAEKAVKAVFQALGGNAFGHSAYMLLRRLPKGSKASDDILESAKTLDKHYVPSRYPNLHPEGAPMDYYTRREAEEATRIATQIIRFCEGRIRAIQEKD